jgi:DedD protein
VKVYTETVKTERGERIRVRVGPFASREAAEDAREKLKAAGLNAALIAPQ